MSVTMIRGTLKPEHVDEAELAVKRMFAALREARPEGVRYASCRVGDSETFVALLQLADGIENPLPAVPEFREFQENLQRWLAGPPAIEQLTVVDSYELF